MFKRMKIKKLRDWWNKNHETLGCNAYMVLGVVAILTSDTWMITSQIIGIMVLVRLAYLSFGDGLSQGVEVGIKARCNESEHWENIATESLKLYKQEGERAEEVLLTKTLLLENSEACCDGLERIIEDLQRENKRIRVEKGNVECEALGDELADLHADEADELVDMLVRHQRGDFKEEQDGIDAMFKKDISKCSKRDGEKK